MDKKKAYVYGYFDIETEDCLYIGISTTPVEERHTTHTKPSRYKSQAINTYLQDNNGTWTLVTLSATEFMLNDETIVKEFVHAIERYFVSKFNPPYNKYLKEEE